MPRANLSRDVIVEAAADLADREGLEAVTLAALARHFQVQSASFYSHVRDRAAVLDGVQALAFRELADQVADAVAGRSARDALIALAETERGYARRSPGRWAALPRRPSDSAAVPPGAERVASLNLAVLRGYGVAEGELIHATRMVGACINGFIALESAGAFNRRSPSTEMSWQRSLKALDTILRNWSVSPPEWEL